MILIDLVGHFSFIVAACSLLMRDIVLLRVLGIFSGLLGIAYNYFITAGPLWVPIIWLFVFMLINVYMIFELYFSNRRSGLTAIDLKIWKEIFWGLPINEYRKIRKIYQSQTYETGEVIIKSGQNNAHIYFVTSGQFLVQRDAKMVAKLYVGDVAGEMSFISDSLPNADVIAEQKSKCIKIEKGKLKFLMLKSPSLQVSMMNLFNKNLISKLNSPI